MTPNQTIRGFRVSEPPAKNLMVYDGDCAFCRIWISRWRALTGDHVNYEPFQKVGDRFLEIPRQEFEKSVFLIEPDGNASRGAEAVFRSLAPAPRRRWMLWLYLNAPGVRFLAETTYRWVARHRAAGYSLMRLLYGRHTDWPKYGVSSWLFLRLLGAVYLIAFVSLRFQIDGLVGREGIVPAERYLNSLRLLLGPERYSVLPTLFWLDSSDSFIHLIAGGGAILSLLLLLGFIPALCLALLWAFYLSLVLVCQDFLSFQWDALLLEAGFLAIFLSPLGARSTLKSASGHSRVSFWLLRWLLFRLIFSSGIAKLVSGDPTWRSLTALNFHYETQPLPTWIGWYAHQLPEWFQQVSVFAILLIEVAVPFLLWAPRRLKLFTAGAFCLSQAAIAATGNYAFFNLLTLALCVLLIDDETWPKSWTRKVEQGASVSRWPGWMLVPVVLVVVPVSCMQLLLTTRYEVNWPKPAIALYQGLAPFRTVNRYGLFAVMTTRRPEIIIEGSNDGETWIPYDFKWKPGDPKREPGFVMPHQPRLDWQMWFAALGRYDDNPWFMPFMSALLRGSPPVVALLDRDPFPDSPPRFIRAALYEYRFSDFATRGTQEVWWVRERIGLYSPVVSSGGDEGGAGPSRLRR